MPDPTPTPPDKPIRPGEGEPDVIASASVAAAKAAAHVAKRTSKRSKRPKKHAAPKRRK